MKNLAIVLLGCLMFFLLLISCRHRKVDVIKLADNEKVWVGVISDGHLMPFKESYQFDMYGNNRSNQVQPLILTSNGQYVWSEEPYRFEVMSNKVKIYDDFNSVTIGKAGNSLAEVQQYVREQFFPATGKIPDELLFTKPQYNTWIELTYNQNQEDIIEYARSIIANDFPVGVIMIDDTWQEDYGLWNFHPGRFPNPRQMMDELHKMGFKVMLWICPFVSADQYLVYNELREKKALLLEKQSDMDTWDSAFEPAIVRWWNGASAVLDFTNPEAIRWFDEQLERLVVDYNVDGFKFDAGDFIFYPSNTLSQRHITPNEHSRLFNEFGLKYPLNEFRASWKMAGEPLAQRLWDKAHDWNDVKKLIPQMVLTNLMGYTFSCPDMIGGGSFTTFLNEADIDQELIVRSAQIHALMPMMQFSVAPWRILNKENFNAVKKAIETREKYMPLIMQLVLESSKTNEPIIKHMEYVFPHQGFSGVNDQFMLGDSILIAPVVDSGVAGREIHLPGGRWLADDGNIYDGNQKVFVDVPIDRLPVFELMN